MKSTAYKTATVKNNRTEKMIEHKVKDRYGHVTVYRIPKKTTKTKSCKSTELK